MFPAGEGKTKNAEKGVVKKDEVRKFGVSGSSEKSEHHFDAARENGTEGWQ